MTKIAELLQQRARAFDEFKVLAEKPILTEAEQAEYETKKRAVTDLDAQIVRAKEAQALSAEHRAAGCRARQSHQQKRQRRWRLTVTSRNAASSSVLRPR